MRERSLNIVCMAVFYLLGMFIGIFIGCWLCS